MVTGRVVQFNETRGYGFIAPDGGGEDVFLHAEELKARGDHVRVGTRVQFDMLEGERGFKAFDVIVLDPVPRPDSAPAAGPSPTGASSMGPSSVGPFLTGPSSGHSSGNSSGHSSVGHDGDEELTEVITEAEYAAELADALITSCPDITGAQIVKVRQRLIAVARKRGWVED